MAESSQAQALNPSQPFDIYKAYREKLNEIPPGLAAVSALTSALTEHRLSTASEAISLLSSLNKTLKSRLRNPVPASAGTDAFIQHLVTSVARPGVDDSNFDQAIRSLQAASDEFVRKGQQATKDITKHGQKLIRDGNIVVVPAVDAAVEGIVQGAAQSLVRFKVVVVKSDAPDCDIIGFTSRLRELEIPTATIEPAAVAHTLSVLAAGSSANVNSPSTNTGVFLLGGASAILSNGGVLATMGTLQACMAAHALGVKTFIASEIWKAVRLLPLAGEEKAYGSSLVWDDPESSNPNGERIANGSKCLADEPMDVTPPNYITGIITESGIRGPAALAEESIKIWF